MKPRSVRGVRDDGVRIAVALGAALFLLRCSAENAPYNTPPCDSVYAGICGGACVTDDQCGTGLYCLRRRCTADCAPGARQCATGMACSDWGRCETVLAADGGRLAGDGSVRPIPIDGGQDACADINVQLARQRATLMLLIDQSGSMTGAFGDTTRWEAVRRTLVHPTLGVVRPLEGEILFGLAMYTSHGGSSGGRCPLIRPPIGAVLNNYDEIAAALNAARPDGDTPTAESVRAAVDLLMTTSPDMEPGARGIVLATDGEPDTCADPDAQSTPARLNAARAGSVAAVRAAFSAGVKTYVIGVGTAVSQMHLQDLANAGAGASDAHFYQATEPAALQEAFRAITSGVRTCVFRLNGRVDPMAADRGTVRLDATPLTYNGPDGWRLRSTNELELTGAACTQARTSASTLTARFPCGVVVPG